MVLKSDIEKAVEVQKHFIKQKPAGQEREMLSKLRLTPGHILIITGIRRCGKSTMMLQLSKKLEEDFAFFNFEDPRVFGFGTEDFSKLDEVLGDKVQVYMFDEVQSVEKWEIFVRNLHDREKKICITGSNASLLSKELGTKLTGRNLQIELFPFSYSEYCSFRKKEKNAVSFRSYLEEGGFPDYLKYRQKESLQQLFKDIIYRDIIVRHGIRNAKSFIDIALYMISNAGKEYSLNGIKKAFDIGSANSVMGYVQWLEDSYLLFSLPRFSRSLKSVAVNPKKIYTIDTGFAQANSMSYSEDIGRLFENAVYLQLRRKYKDLYYFRERKECDFVIKEERKITKALQVCSEINSDNLPRESEGLIEALNFFKLKEGVIVTLDQEDELIKEGKKIKLVPAWKWFDEMD